MYLVSSPFRRQRKTITSFALGVWLFALFIGFAHACGLDEPASVQIHVAAANSGERSLDLGAPDGCEQFCKADMPVVTQIPPLGDQPCSVPLTIAARDIGVAFAFPPASRSAQVAHPPPDVPAFLRFAHLRL